MPFIHGCLTESHELLSGFGMSTARKVEEVFAQSDPPTKTAFDVNEAGTRLCSNPACRGCGSFEVVLTAPKRPNLSLQTFATRFV